MFALLREAKRGSSSLYYEHVAEHKDREGGYILIIGIIDCILISFINAYAPPGSDWSFYKKITELAATKSQEVIIFAVDFNIRLNPNLNSSNGKTNSKYINKRIKNMMNELGLMEQL